MAPARTAVVAMGGDGTVGACAAGLGEAGPDCRAALGLIPAGGGNDIARVLGLPFSDPLAAATLLPTLVPRRVDLVRAGERLFLNSAGAGFDSEASRFANQRLAKAPPRLRYIGAMLAELALWRPACFRIALDGRQLEARGWLVAIGNGQSYGGGMRIAPDARLDDGLLDVVVIDRGAVQARLPGHLPQDLLRPPHRPPGHQRLAGGPGRAGRRPAAGGPPRGRAQRHAAGDVRGRSGRDPRPRRRQRPRLHAGVRPRARLCQEMPSARVFQNISS